MYILARKQERMWRFHKGEELSIRGLPLTLSRKWAGHIVKHLRLSDNFACLDMLPFTKQERHILGNSNTMGLSVREEKAEKNAKRQEHLSNLLLGAQQIPPNILLWSPSPPYWPCLWRYHNEMCYYSGIFYHDSRSLCC